LGDNIPIGIIGAGFISRYHLAGLRAAGGSVVAISSASLERAQQRAAEFDVPFYTDDYRAVLRREDVTAVVIATPDFTHRDIAVEALYAGKAALLQKPMARTSAECRDIIAAAVQSGSALAVSFMHRYFEEVLALRQLLSDGVLGQLYMVRQRNATPGAGWADWFYRRENVGGGAMMQIGIHGVDLLRHLFGEIVAVSATTAQTARERRLADGRVVTPDNEDLILATYRFESGLLATHETLYNETAGTDRFRLEVYGEKGTAWLRTERGSLALYIAADDGEAEWIAPALPDSDPGERQHRHWLDRLRGAVPDDRSAYDGLVAVGVVEAVYRSAESGRWEAVVPG
jgi:myo-inositol 2-dehydrogenase/D-chiro-inositol 1-dehydrogenase